MPNGHLPVRSYLAVPVTTRSGEVLGGLFFGHPQPGMFTERAERLVTAIASQAAVAIDNVRLYQALQRELEARRQAEQNLRQINETLEQRAGERTRELADTERRFRLLVEGDALYQQQAGELDRSRREAVLFKIQRLMVERTIYAPIWQLAFINGIGPRVGESGLGRIQLFPYTAPYEDITIKGT
jgi:GAF domain-containing protein